MSQNPPQPPTPPLPPTPYAQKYGLTDPDQMPLLSHQPTSGLSPRLQNPTSKMAYLLTTALETAQREELNGFTTLELCDLGAHGIRRNVKAANLNGPIHPIFDRGSQWVGTLVGHQVGVGGVGGVWDVGNEGVWGVMVPVLRLASRFLGSCWLHSWFKAIMFGELRPIEDSRFGGGENTGYPRYYVSFHNVQEQIPNDLVDAKWMELIRNVKFAMGVNIPPDIRARTKVGTNPDCGYLPPIRRVLPDGASRIEINVQCLKPLLYDLSVSERLITQFLLAKTIVHELCHAIGKFRALDIPFNPIRPDVKERVNEKFFYEDEFYVELGYSYENAVFGGVIRPIAPGETYGHDQKRLDLPFPPIAALIGTWPDYSKIFAKDRLMREPGWASEIKIPALKQPRFTPMTISTLSVPIHLSYIEDMHQEEYWQNCIPKWGADMMKIFPRIFSIRIYRDPSNPQQEKSLMRHFGGSKSVEAAKAQFPNSKIDEQMRNLCIRRFRVVQEMCNRLRERRNSRRVVEGMFGPIGYWDPDSDVGDRIPEIDDEEKLRDAIAEALGTTRENLNPQFSSEFLIKYFFLSPSVPAEKAIDIGGMILDFNSFKETRYTADQFMQRSEADLEWCLRRQMAAWGYPPNYPWSKFADSFGSVRAAKRFYEAERKRLQGVDKRGRIDDDGGGGDERGAKRKMDPRTGRPMLPVKQGDKNSEPPGPNPQVGPFRRILRVSQIKKQNGMSESPVEKNRATKRTTDTRTGRPYSPFRQTGEGFGAPNIRLPEAEVRRRIQKIVQGAGMRDEESELEGTINTSTGRPHFPPRQKESFFGLPSPSLNTADIRSRILGAIREKTRGDGGQDERAARTVMDPVTGRPHFPPRPRSNL